MKQILLTSAVFLILSDGFGQFRSGLHLSNYNTSQSILLQPASGFNSPNNLDITFLGGHTFIENDYTYFIKSSVIEVIRNRDKIEVIEYQNETESISNTGGLFPVYLTFFNPSKPMDVFIKNDVLGPSFSINVENWSFGAFTKMSQAVSINDVDQKLHYFNIKDQARDLGQLQPVDLNMLNWAEIGVNVAKRWTNQRDQHFIIGANIKYLMGIDALHLKAQSNLAFGAQIQTLNNTSADLQYATNIDENGDYKMNVNGRGVGADLGLTFVQGGFGDRPYRYKLGVSVLDFGRIKFKDRAQSYQFNAESNVVFDSSSFVSDQSVKNYVTSVANAFNSNPDALQNASTFYSFLPTVLHVNADFCVSPVIFINASATRGLKLADNQLRTGNIMQASARYESHWFEAGMPITLYNDRDLRLGSWVRIGPITIGSDHVLSLITSQKELSGTDIYASLKWIPFNTNSNSKRGKKAKDMGCFKF